LAELGESSNGVLRVDFTPRRKREIEPDREFKKSKIYHFNANITNTVLQLLKDVIVTPPKKIRNTPEWQDDGELQDWTLNNTGRMLGPKRGFNKTSTKVINFVLKIFSFLEIYLNFFRLPGKYGDGKCTPKRFY
jgi:hypothetical protein